MAEFNESAEDFVDALGAVPTNNEDGDTSPVLGVESINFDDLEILENVGRGAYGTVQKAKWKNRFIVAVKTIEDTNISNEDVRGEVNGLSRVKHENVIRLYGTSQHKEKSCLVMEYAECGSLYDLLHPSELKNSRLIPYTFGHVISWALQCALAMEYLHNLRPNAIIHRDLKPPNMLLTEYGTKIKICDFGTATVQKTFMTSNKGSAAWMAPEVFEGTAYTNTCDVYSFGIILWEMITRRKPFEEIGGPPYTVLWAVHEGKRPPPVKGIPKCFENLMVRCWTKDQKSRPQFTTIVRFLQKAQKFVSGGDEPLFKDAVEEAPSSFSRTAWEDSQVQTSFPQEFQNFPEERSDFGTNESGTEPSSNQKLISTPTEEAKSRQTFPPNSPTDPIHSQRTPDFERSTPYGTPGSERPSNRSRNPSLGSTKSPNEVPVPSIIRTTPSNDDMKRVEQENWQRHQFQQQQHQQYQQQQQQQFYIQQLQRAGFTYQSMADSNYPPVFPDRQLSQNLPFNRTLYPQIGPMTQQEYNHNQDMYIRQLQHPPYVQHQRSDPDGVNSTDNSMSFDMSKTMPPNMDSRYNSHMPMNYNGPSNPTNPFSVSTNPFTSQVNRTNPFAPNQTGHPTMQHSVSMMQPRQSPNHPPLQHSNTTGHLPDFHQESTGGQGRSEFDLPHGFRAMSIDKSPGDFPHSTRKKMFDHQTSHLSSTGSSRSSTPTASEMFDESMAHSPKGMTSARRSESKLNYRRQKSDLEVSRHGSRNVEVSLFKQDYMPLPPIHHRPESVKVWEQHMEALNQMAELKAKYTYLLQRGEEIDKQLQDQKVQQQRNSQYLEEFVKLEKEKHDLLMIHRSAKTQLERARSGRTYKE